MIAHASTFEFGNLQPEIYSFDKRDFANWLHRGVLVYHGLIKHPPSLRIPDAFEFAKLYIGQNDNDLVADLVDVYNDLGSYLQIAFREGVAKKWSELEFLEKSDFVLGESLLDIACRIKANEIVDVLPTMLDKIDTAESDLKNNFKELRIRAFKVSIELASGSLESMTCIDRFVNHRIDFYDVISPKDVLPIVTFLGSIAPLQLYNWLCIFGIRLVRAVNLGNGERGVFTPDEALTQLKRAYGNQEVERVFAIARAQAVQGETQVRSGFSEDNTRGFFDFWNLLDTTVTIPTSVEGHSSAAPDQSLDKATIINLFDCVI